MPQPTPTMRNDTGVPLYIQLKEILKTEILNGRFQPGEQIPPETDLCEQYNISRITVRQAINSLVQEKLLYRQQGKGTFVTVHKLRRYLPKLYSFSDDMRELGLNPGSTILVRRVEKANKAIARLLQLAPANSKVYKLVRVRLVNGEPILLENTYIPFALCPELMAYDLEQDSLYRILTEEYGLMLNHAEESYEAILLNPQDAEALQCDDGLPAFSIERVAFLKTGTPIELTRSVGRGDRLRFTLQLISDRTQFLRKVEL